MRQLYLLLFSLLFLGCESEKYVITEVGDFRLLSLTGNLRSQDTISGPFALEVRFSTMNLASNWNVIPTAQAFSKTITYLNAIDLSTIKVTINKNFKVGKQQMNAGDVISGYKFSDVYPNPQFTPQYLLRAPYLSINFSQDVLAQLTFEKGLTKFTLIGKNTDSISFKFEKEVYIDL